MWIGLIVSLMAAGGFVAGRVGLRPKLSVTQPISFNHRMHVEILECENCHQFFGESEHSGLPELTLCLDCHEEPQTDSAEEERIRELAAAGQTEIFRKLFRLPDHVFYSHRRHVVIAGLECEACHGAIAETEAPPQQPLMRITMDFCLECHLRDDVPSDCTRCHN